MRISKILQGRKLKTAYALKAQELDLYERVLENITISEASVTSELKRLKWYLCTYNNLLMDYYKYSPAQPDPKTAADYKNKKGETDTHIRQLVSEITDTKLEKWEETPLMFNDDIEQMVRNKKAEKDALIRQKDGVKNNMARLFKEMQELQNKMGKVS